MRRYGSSPGRRRWRRAAALLLMALGAAAPGRTLAQATEPAAGEVVVRLRDGSVFRGEVIESIPGDHPTLRLPMGEFRHLEAGAIAAQEAGPPLLPAPGVPVRLQANTASAAIFQMTDQQYLITGYRGDGAVQPWRRACGVPCEAVLDPRGTYRVWGEGLVPSAPFSLPARGPVTLRARVGHTGALAGAFLLLGLGAGLTGMGAGTLAIGQAHGADAGDPALPSTRSDGEALTRAGAIVLGLSPVPVIIGVLVLLRNRTLVRLESGPRLAGLRF